MARELSNTHTRLVVSGDGSAPSGCNVETRVENDGLSEQSKSHVIESPDFNQTVAAFCAAAASTVKTIEGIT